LISKDSNMHLESKLNYVYKMQSNGLMNSTSERWFDIEFRHFFK